MGQYLKGRKIGTCESMYYMRLSEAELLAKLGVSDDDGIKFSEYLNDNSTKFRFPFPDEDGKPELYHENDYNKGFSIPTGNVQIAHDTICIWSENKRKGSGFNIMLPCPYSRDFKDMQMYGLKTSRGGAGEQYIDVTMEAYRDFNGTKKRKIKTIFECAKCGQMQYADDKDIAKIKEHAIEHFKCYDTTGKNPEYQGNQAKYDNAMEIIKRMH